MQGKLAILLLVAVAAFALPSREGSSRIFHSPGDREYILIVVPEPYESSKATCQGYEAKLAELETKEEQDYIIDWILELNEPQIGQLWLGGKWNGNGSFVWENGAPLRNDSTWYPGEPSERNGNSRVALLATNSTHNGFKSVNEDVRNQCLCQNVD